MKSIEEKRAEFRKLHQSGCFAIPNPWDIGTAKYLQHLGFKAIATTSAGFAFSRGLSDGAVTRDDMLAHIRELVEATDIPVNADFENGYADDPNWIAENARLCAETGVAGLSIEDVADRKESPLYDVDLADKTQVDALIESLARDKIDIDLLINNAGLGDLGAFASSDPDRNDAMLLVNVLALTTLTRKLLPQMIARKRGAILNVSSLAGFLPIPGTAVYAATKAYVNSLSEALRAESRGCGVIVTALCPGPVHTEFQEVASRPGRKVKPGPGPDFLHVPVEQVVRDALAAVQADRPLVIPGLAMKLGMFLVRLTPMSILRRAWRFSAKRGR